MAREQTKPQTIDDYIARFPEDVQNILQQIRSTIQEASTAVEPSIQASH